MASTTFITDVTVIEADWLNDVNDITYGITETTGLAVHKADLANPHSVTQTQVGLSNVDNTSDATQQAATLLAATKSDVDLANVDNTSDANKPVSTAQQTALDLKYTITTADAKFLHFPDAAAVLIESVANRASKFLGFDAAGEMIYTAGSAAVSADAVSITDAGGYYAGIQVEAALQELGLWKSVSGLQAHPNSPFATTSGSDVLVSLIPSWAKKITLAFNGVSTSSAIESYTLHLGDSGGLHLSGYISRVMQISAGGNSLTASSLHAVIGGAGNAAHTFSGLVTITLVDETNFDYVITGNCSHSGGSFYSSTSEVSLDTVLTQLRVSAIGTYDAGEFSVHYDG